MKDKNKIIGLVGVLVALASSTACADVVVVSASASGVAGGSPVHNAGVTYTADLQQFDPSLGTLTSVGLVISGTHSGTIEFTSNGPGGGYIVRWVDYSFEVNGLGGTDGNLLFLDWVTEPTTDDPFGVAPGHFNTGFVNLPEGQTATESFGTQLDFDDTYVAGDSEFAQFIGTGTLPFEIVDWNVFSIATAGGNTPWQLLAEADLFVEATYTFTAVPSPSSFLLLLAVFSGLLAGRRFRTN